MTFFDHFSSLLPRAITGDRPTGPLHVGHLAGSLLGRVAMQHTHRLTVLVADAQTLTDKAQKKFDPRPMIDQVMMDYLAVGIDPHRVRFVLQSRVPELFELTALLMNIVHVGQLRRNPTVRSEMQSRGFGQDMPAGFLCYPIAQAADILGLGGGVVPVGDDQLPMIELTNDLGRRLNDHLGQTFFEPCRAQLSSTPRLPSIDGTGKMSKSLGGVIALGDAASVVRERVMAMYTDPGHLRLSDPGQIEGNVVFSFLDAFDPNRDEVNELKAHYRRGGLGDVAVKKRLIGVMEHILGPIRERRRAIDHPEGHAHRMMLLQEGTKHARQEARLVLRQVRSALNLPDLDQD